MPGGGRPDSIEAMPIHELLAESTVGAYTLTGGRFTATLAALVALAGAVVGGATLARSAGPAGARRRRAIFALAAGLLGIVIGGLVVATADGGPGSGSGVVGGFAALALGLLATVLGSVVLARRA
jgi:hypothetical protein